MLQLSLKLAEGIDRMIYISFESTMILNTRMATAAINAIATSRIEDQGNLSRNSPSALHRPEQAECIVIAFTQMHTEIRLRHQQKIIVNETRSNGAELGAAGRLQSGWRRLNADDTKDRSGDAGGDKMKTATT